MPAGSCPTRRTLGGGHGPRPRTGRTSSCWRRVDLWGRLSNPHHGLRTLVGQGIEGAHQVTDAGSGQPQRSPRLATPNPSVPLSNPDRAAPATSRRAIQRRLDDAEIDLLTAGYQAGQSVADLATEFGIHRATTLRHLRQRGVPGRRITRKLSDIDVAKAAVEYAGGKSLVAIGNQLGVDPETVRREFLKAGVERRSRRQRK